MQSTCLVATAWLQREQPAAVGACYGGGSGEEIMPDDRCDVHSSPCELIVPIRAAVSTRQSR